MTRSSLGPEWDDLAGDAELVVSELVTNATLHGEPPIVVRLLAGDRIRVEVHDGGRSAPIVVKRNTEAMTGRGLALVAAVSAEWGVEAAESGGKVVWAELAREAAPSGQEPDVDLEALLDSWSDEDPATDVHTVRLGAVSTGLLLAAKSHIDNVVRELTLVREGEAARGRRLPHHLEALVESVAGDFAAARTQIKRQAVASAARGDAITDLELQLSPAAADAGERYLAALDQADRHARASDLLTLAAPRVHRLFRQWYVRELVAQLRALSSGEAPPTVRSFQDVLADEITELGEIADISAQLALLQKVTSMLADADGAEEMARIVVDNAVRFLGVETARVRLLGDDGMLRSVAWRGRHVDIAEPQAEYSIDSDLPGARAARTGRTVYMRSLRRTFARIPGLGEQYPAGRSGNAVPLMSGSQPLGVLTLTFVSGEMSDEAQLEFVESLADALAQGLRRVRLAASDRQRSDTLSFLSDALEMLVSVDDPGDVLERLVTHAVPRVADWCTVYVGDGDELKRAAMAIDGFPELADRLKQAPPLSRRLDLVHNRVYETGRPEAIDSELVQLLESLYPGLDLSELGGATRTSGLCVPIDLRGRRLGVIALAFTTSGRQVNPAVVQALTGLAERAALAFELTDLRRSQREPADRVVLELAVSAGGIGTFDWDLLTGRLLWDEVTLQMFGFDSGTLDRSIGEFFERVHPADQDRVRELLQRAIERCGVYDSEYRVVLPGGGLRWVAARGRALPGPEGRAVRLIGAVHDTTDRRDSDARVARVLDSMSAAFFFLDREWRFAYVNSQAEVILGRPAGDLLGQVVWDLFPATVGSDFETFYRHAARTGEPVAFDAYYPEPLNAWYEVRAWPQPDGLAVYSLDITALRRARERAERAISRAGLLSRVTEELASVLDPSEAMRVLAQLVVPALADWAVVTLIDDDAQVGDRRGLRQAAGWHHRPGLRDLVNLYAEARLEAMTDDAIVVRAVESAEPQLLSAPAMEALRPMFHPGTAALEMLEQLAPAAVAVLPLNGRTYPVGMLTLCADPQRGDFGDEDLELARDIAARAGVVLDRARLYRQQREVAETLQRSLLTDPPATEELEIAVRYAPAAEAAQVGGDWYDSFTQRDGSVMLVIGDVMGHDLHAAAAMGQVRTLVRGIGAHGGQGPAQLLEDVEAAMGTLRLDTTATVVVARVEQADTTGGPRRRFRWSNAGHPPPILIDADGAVEVLEAPAADLLLGAMGGTERHELVADLRPGAAVILYTDGLVEERERPLDAGIDRLRELLSGLAAGDLEDLCDRVLAQMMAERPEDDVALLAVRLRPA